MTLAEPSPWPELQRVSCCEGCCQVFGFGVVSRQRPCLSVCLTQGVLIMKEVAGSMAHTAYLRAWRTRLVVMWNLADDHRDLAQTEVMELEVARLQAGAAQHGKAWLQQEVAAKAQPQLARRLDVRQWVAGSNVTKADLAAAVVEQLCPQARIKIWKVLLVFVLLC